MAQGNDVLQMLCPNVEYTICEDDYDSIIWNSGKAAITKKQFEDGFAKFDAWKAKQDATQATAKAAAQAKLAALGLTVEDLTALGL
jgi:hypothetical protein